MKHATDGAGRSKKKLLWRCRRGTRELELLLYRYIDEHYDSLSDSEVNLLHEFVELDHHKMNNWLLLDIKTHKNNKYKSLIQAIQYMKWKESEC